MDSPPIGTVVVKEIADREGVDPVTLDVPLYTVIDADALEALVNGADQRQPETMPRVEFTYYGYAVTVHGDRRVSVDEPPPEPEPDSDESSGRTSGAA